MPAPGPSPLGVLALGVRAGQALDERRPAGGWPSHLDSEGQQEGACACLDLFTGPCPRAGGNLAGGSAAEALAEGAAGNGTTPTPALAADPSLAFTAAAVVDGGACGLLANGSVACVCGYADAAQERALPAEPRLLFNGTGGFRALAARHGTVCGVAADGAVVCQGAGLVVGCRQPRHLRRCACQHSQDWVASLSLLMRFCTPGIRPRPLAGVVGGYLVPEGYPDIVFSAAPALIDGSRNYTAVSIGGSGLAFHACGLTAAGEALCWCAARGDGVGTPGCWLDGCCCWLLLAGACWLPAMLPLSQARCTCPSTRHAGGWTANCSWAAQRAAATAPPRPRRSTRRCALPSWQRAASSRAAWWPDPAQSARLQTPDRPTSCHT